MALEAGTYRLDRMAVGYAFPEILATVPAGWLGEGPFLYIQQDGRAVVGVGFWDVDQVYGHPCQWDGTLFRPGPTVDDLAAALADRPMRNATTPVDVTLGGATGKYLEWSVPADIEQDEQGNFVDCDPVPGGSGERAFESWTGKGWGTDRYHQGPGQIDRVWILDVDGSRLVIDAMSLASATDEQIGQLREVVASVRFRRT